MNSLDKGDGKKCTDVGLGDCCHMGVIAVVLFYKHVGPPSCFLKIMTAVPHVSKKNMTAHYVLG